jgi:hypothetical protein
VPLRSAYGIADVEPRSHAAVLGVRLVPRWRSINIVIVPAAVRYTEAFAKLNGWSPSNEHFSFRQLAGKRRDRGGDDMPIWRSGADDPDHVLDHLAFFRRERKPIAVISMPYHGDREAAQQLAAHYGLVMLAPPIATAGWWLPGTNGTECFVFVRSGTAVRWLPGQEDEAAYERFAEEHAEDQCRRVEEYERQKAAWAAKQEKRRMTQEETP